ncbi:MAG TPA: glutathione-disulfide reductase [Gammaproteobacteria bacterium]|nr:glutathione-disulfide reductase [Gammaproteobacteria bacterium]HCA35803.1 glutathione-disulfide reductase [Gammaproteobacteria bacterium]
MTRQNLQEGYSNLSDFDFDLFVIGAGSGGVRASRIAASLGAQVAVAEERYFGGTCVNVGCVPKKLYSYAAHYRDDLEDSRRFGWSSQDLGFDWGTLKANKDQEINRLNGIYKSILDNNGVTVFEDRARMLGPNLVQVGDAQFSARYVLLAVGGWPYIPEYTGSEHAITSNEVFEMEQLPSSMVVVGGGYIAVEFASIFSRLGVDTTLLYRGERLLRGFDADVRDLISSEMGHHARLILSDDVEHVVKENNSLRIHLKSGLEIEAETLLSATGRVPLTQDLGLENTAVKLDERGAVCVNEEFQTAEPSIYAVGDVIDRVALTPVALAEGQWLAGKLFGSPARDVSYHNIATAVFCHPNVATCGYSEEKALEAGLEIDVYVARFKQLKHTLSGREEYSLFKLIVEQSSDRVIGAHIVAPDAGELMQGIAVAMTAGATKAQFDATIGIHPTLAEEFVTMREKRVSRET